MILLLFRDAIDVTPTESWEDGKIVLDAESGTVKLARGRHRLEFRENYVHENFFWYCYQENFFDQLQGAIRRNKAIVFLESESDYQKIKQCLQRMTPLPTTRRKEILGNPKSNGATNRGFDQIVGYEDVPIKRGYDKDDWHKNNSSFYPLRHEGIKLVVTSPVEVELLQIQPNPRPTRVELYTSEYAIWRVRNPYNAELAPFLAIHVETHTSKLFVGTTQSGLDNLVGIHKREMLLMPTRDVSGKPAEVKPPVESTAVAVS